MNEPIATLGDTCDQAHRFTQVLFMPHEWRRDWLVVKVGMECCEKEFVYEYDEVRDLRDRLSEWLGDTDALRTLREYGRGLLRGDLQSDVQDPRDVQAMLHMLPSVLYPLPRMAASRQGAGGPPMIPEGLLVLMPRGYGRILYRAYKGYEDMCLIRNWCGCRKLTYEEEGIDWEDVTWPF